MNSKTVAMRYFSKTGNTKKLADAIAKATGSKALTIDTPVEERVDVLFLGASVYAGGIDAQVKNFIRTLDAKKVGKVAVFSTSALVERAYPQISKLLQAQGISVINDDFYCRGQFAVLHKNRPNADDLQAAKAYAKRVCAKEEIKL